MKITRAHELPPIDAALIKQIYKKVKNTPKDGNWRTLSGVLRIKGQEILVSCDFVLHGAFISLDNLELNFPEKSLLVH